MLPLLPGRHVLDLRQGARANAPHPSPLPPGEGTARPTPKHRADGPKPCGLPLAPKGASFVQRGGLAPRLEFGLFEGGLENGVPLGVK